MKISVVINTYNSELFLERVLDSVKDFDEILICDMHSTDRTLEIAKKYNCRVIFHEKVGFVEPARSYAISQATHDWVLVVDSDELVPPDLKDFLYQFLDAPSNIGSIRIPRKNYFMGRFMHGTYPDYIYRFLKKEGTVWPETIHSQPIVSGETYTIPRRRSNLAFIHLSNESIKQTINKMNVYTELEVERRKHKKYNALSLIVQPLFRFIKSYIINGGFLDGAPGFIKASFDGYYRFVIVSKILESKIKPSDWDQNLRE